MPFFDMEFYSEDNPTACAQWLFPLQHYVEYGAAEGRSPNRFFDPAFYKDRYGLDDLAGADIFFHYAATGAAKGYRPSALFDPVFYRENYPPAEHDYSLPLEHYQEKGVLQGFYPAPEVADLAVKPVISILTPVYDTDEQLLRRCIHSVLYQAYPHWELCLVDDGSPGDRIRPLLQEYAARDPRIKVRFLEQNQGISAATNAAAELATGEYIAFLDHDDELTLDALFAVVEAINHHDPDIIYSDEELIDRESRHLERFYKPDYNPELLLCHNYITHFCVTRRQLFEQVHGVSLRCTGAQDYDLLLKLTEHTSNVHHIRRPIYKWRATETSTSINHEGKDYAHNAGLQALRSAVARRGMDAEVDSGQWNYYYRLRRSVSEHPRVAIIAWLTGDCPNLQSWLQALAERTEYREVTVHFVGMSHDGHLDAALVDAFSRKPVCHPPVEHESTAQALNRVAAEISDAYLIFLQAGVLPRESDWIEILLGYCRDAQYGAAAPLPDSGLVEDPALPDVRDLGSRAFRSFVLESSFHLNGVLCPQNVIAVSCACCMVESALFQEIGGFDAQYFPEFLFDADFCLRLREKGVEHVMTPFCTIDVPLSGEKQAADDAGLPDWQRERARFQERWREILLHHPYYNEQRLLDEQSVSLHQWQQWEAGKVAVAETVAAENSA
jgi:glycosyltransferase involved in cell wall biosynthesis